MSARRRQLLYRPGVLALPLALVGLCLLLLGGCGDASEDAARAAYESLLDEAPTLGWPQAGFVGSGACRACHADEHESWSRSWHRTMTQLATPEAVRAPFKGVTLTSAERIYRLDEQDGGYWAEMPDPARDLGRIVRNEDPRIPDPPDVPRSRRRILFTTGSHHMQTYWVGSGRGDRTLYTFPFVYLFDEARWVKREEVFVVPPGEGRMRAVWNDNCLRCHATGGQPQQRDGVLAYQTRVAELGIACEACHGPGREHVDYYAARKDVPPESREPGYAIVHPLNIDPRLSAQVCGQCHSSSGAPTNDSERMWFKHGYPYRAGDDLWLTRGISRHPAKASVPGTEKVPPQNWPMLEKHLDFFFWRDGMIRVSGREYNGLLETACYQRGDMTCLTCHSMHDSEPAGQLRRDAQGDATCLPCHESLGSDIAAHTHHATASAGSRCLNCHMPHTSYGLLKAIRSHTISSPNVQESLAPVGRPNACNACHLDQTLAWTDRHLQDWYGAPAAKLPEVHTQWAAGLVWLVAGDAGQRALTAWHMGWPVARAASGSDWMVPYLAESAAMDPYAAVRKVARDALRKREALHDLPFLFDASVEARQGAASAMLERWSKQRARPLDRAGPRVGLDADGQLDEEAVKRLRAGRDNRPVFLGE